MKKDMGACPTGTGLSPPVEPVPVSPPDGASIPSAVPTLEERNEEFIPPHFDMRGGKLGETPILWQFRMAYEWKDHFAEESPDWDQCCTCRVFAISEGEARRKVWDKFRDGLSVKPEAIASCYPERFRNQRDDELDAYWSAQAIEARRAETGTGSVHESAVAESDAPEHSGRLG